MGWWRGGRASNRLNGLSCLVRWVHHRGLGVSQCNEYNIDSIDSMDQNLISEPHPHLLLAGDASQVGELEFGGIVTTNVSLISETSLG